MECCKIRLVSERRVHDRVPAKLAVDYADAAELVSDTTVNVSIGGTFIITEREVAVGDQVELSLSFPGLVAPIEMPGIVRWCQERGGSVRGVGVEFSDSDSATTERLKELLAAIRRGEPHLVTRPMSVLLVDDNRHVSELIEQGLALLSRRSDEPLVFSFRTAKDGREGLDLARTDTPDLIIVDLQLPVLDGEQLIRQLRASEMSMPIVAISALGEEGRESALGAGANAYVCKPMRLRELRRAVRVVMKLES